MSSPENHPADGGVHLASNITHDLPEPPISKNKLKKLLRDQKWEEGREERKEIRKIKAKEKRERKRAARDTDAPSEPTAGKRKASVEPEVHPGKKPKLFNPVQLPVSFVIDCDFDDIMRDGERTSLAAQVTRSYSENHKAPFRSHLFISSFGGLLKQRFDTVLSGQHHSWKGVEFLEDDFAAAARQAAKVMKTDRGGKLAGAFQPNENCNKDETTSSSGEVVYLTSDSPDTLTELKPYSTYIIGGIVDKNRHKGICYKRALDKGMKTAKLPIGDYMKMASRFVLATNHVVEIMLRWLEVGDWGKAFTEVIPQRKGGVLKDGVSGSEKPPDTMAQDEEADHRTLEENQQKGESLGENVDQSHGNEFPAEGLEP
ncbi:MAG: hypothetical protein L6R40_004474 [Gallowayella cf. fulva]|nr:MAG: hypothetical protein L6R40_004474 [Xanthomendoza cf. fulva]